MFKRYYEDELAFLREMGGEFARAYPDIARELGLSGSDPDVERLLQGVAFLTGRIRQGLDAQFPELLYPLLGHLWPQALRPSPCAVILEFQPRPNMFRSAEVLKAGSLVRSVPVDGTACQFQTAYRTPILPLKVEQVRLSTPSLSQVRLSLHLLPLPGVAFNRLGNHPLRLYFHGAGIKGMGREAYGLHAWLGHYLRAIRLRVRSLADDRVLGERALPREALRPVGWEAEESLLPYPSTSFGAPRHLIEYFLFSAKYLFFDLHGLAALAELPAGERLEIEFDLAPLPGDPLSPTAEHIRTNCVPAVNLFPHTAMPLSVDGTRSEYQLRPEGSAAEHYDIFSVERVFGHSRRASQPVDYLPFFSFHRPKVQVGEQPVMYQVLKRPPVSSSHAARDDLPAYPAVPTYLSFVEPSGGAAALQAIVSVDLLCTNRDLPTRLRSGEICKPTADIPSTLQFHDIGGVSAPAPAPVGGDGLWRLFAHVLTGLDALKDRDSLRTLLQLYHFPARFNQPARQKLEALLDAVAELQSAPEVRMVGHPPAVLRGTKVVLALHESRFSHFGELVLFGGALEHFLAESAAVNSYTQLLLRGIDQGFELAWPARLGTQRLV